MKKLLQWLDNNLLKFATIATFIFLTLYPKLPSIQVTHTWVYIRLEDFAIAIIVGIWLVQLVRKKVRLAFPMGIPIIVYWLVGLISLSYCLLFLAPHLANFFPKIAALQYFRRIEYMILFFVAFSTIKSVRDIRDYIIGLCVAVTGVILYGLGQHFYLDLWKQFPQFFEKYPFCFPAFETGNEEFAKGIPLCLPDGARTTSTFGGHYDLAAYLVLVLPLLFSVALAIKKKTAKVFLGLLYVSGLMLLIFTASRTSFVTYLVGIIAALIFLGKKKLIAPVIGLSIVLLLVFSSSTAQRFLETLRFTSVVTNSQGQVVGMDQGGLSETLRKKISKEPVIVSDQAPSQTLPTGSSFITLPQAPVTTTVAVVQKKIDPKEAERLKLAYGGLEISSISGTFLVQKALVYDISFTTRFQAEWPRDWAAFLKSPVLGTGYSSLTLASDNDYLRALGETGFLGLLSFLFIFVFLGIFLKENGGSENKFAVFVGLGLAGGVVGLFSNAILIDVFEASKVAEPLWILLGASVGALAISQKHVINYKQQLWQFFCSSFMLGIYLLTITFVFFGKSLSNYFVADDFTWLRWAASSTTRDIGKYFTDAQGFFYRPIDKTIMLVLYTFFSFQPLGFHLVNLFIHFLIGLFVYVLIMQITNKRIWAFLGGILFLLMPSHPENLFWISTMSANLCSLFLLLSIVSFISAQRRKTLLFYPLAVLFGLLGLFSYEMGVIIPLLVLAIELILFKEKNRKRIALLTTPFLLSDGFYLFVRSKAHVAAVAGDYSYSVAHLIPNFIGNLLGYISYFLVGDTILPIYTLLRSNLKQSALPIGIVAVFVLFIGGFVWWTYRNKIAIRQPLTLLGFMWMVIGLLPFLGLGNLATRYGYFASIGFILVIVSILIWLSTKKLFQKNQTSIVIILFLLIGVWSWLQIDNQNRQWNEAGKITYSTLGFFKIEHPDLPPESIIFVVNTPIKHNNAWVFPVGLEDGLWFIYRQYLPPIVKAKDIKDAQNQAKDYVNPYIFEFDNKGVISEIK